MVPDDPVFAAAISALANALQAAVPAAARLRQRLDEQMIAVRRLQPNHRDESES